MNITSKIFKFNMTQSNVAHNQVTYKFNGLCIFVAVYVGLFIIASVILLTSLSHIRRNEESLSQNAYTTNKISHSPKIYNTKKSYDTINLLLNDAPHAYSSLNDLFGHTLFLKNDSNFFLGAKRLNSLFGYTRINLDWPHSFSGLVNCTSIQEVHDLSFVAGGWTKSVYKGTFRGRSVAVKIVNYYGHDVQECQKQHDTLNLCYERAEIKILKEIILLHALSHSNVVKVIGYCIPDAIGTIALVTELGIPLDLLYLLQISWEDRLRLVFGIAHILQHLAHSPLGPLSVNDFRRQQFVLIDGEIKLSDVDDLGIGEPECENDEICRNIFPQLTSCENSEVSQICHSYFRCLNHQCMGHNSRVNIWHAGQHFVKLLLPIGAPTDMKSQIENLLSAYELNQKFDEVDSSYILKTTVDLVNFYKSGKYFNESGEINKLASYQNIKDSDLPGMFDYHCRNSISAGSCVMSIFNEEEAVYLCNLDTNCKAVVITLQHTWTGRTIAVFKNGTTTSVKHKEFTLLVKDELTSYNENLN